MAQQELRSVTMLTMADAISMPSFVERFWSKVLKADSESCWDWQASLSVHGGYGQLTAGRGLLLKAHRVAYALEFGIPPAGLFVCHRCNNPRCCNPAHLYAGTPKDNWNDTRKAGRAYKFQPKKLENSPCAKLSNEQARMVLTSKRSGADLARELGVTCAAISSLRRRRTWKTL